MNDKTPPSRSRKRRRRGEKREAPVSLREVNYRNLRNPFPPMDVFSRDQIASIHDTALKTLEELGMKVLLPEAIEVLQRGGARVEGDMVYIGREVVDTAIASAPKSITGRGGSRQRDVLFELGTLTFQPGAGAPHATDLERGRRPGSCLLYTSPSPRDGLLSRMPSSA